MNIKQIQNLLQYLGYYNGKITGIWSESYQDAVIAFQDDFGGIAVDGIAEAETQKALRHAVAYGMPVYEVKSKPESGDFWDDIEFFTRDEFKCKCGGEYCRGYPSEPKKALVQLAESARKHFGRPAYVVSGLRCQEWNRIQGGVVNSQHMYGEAVDLQIKGVSADELLAYIKTQHGVRYAYKINDTNVHFDIPRGAR